MSKDVEGEYSGASSVVVGDAARLAQVMRNLVSNALKFTPRDGSITVQVSQMEGGLPESLPVVPDSLQHLLEQPRAGSVRISVIDSGAGLSEEQLTKICSEGVQFNANELQAGKGSGLGLFITKGIVEQHGGKLTVASAGIGAGTTFTVELPLFVRITEECSTEIGGDFPENENAPLPLTAPVLVEVSRVSEDQTTPKSLPPVSPVSPLPPVSLAPPVLKPPVEGEDSKRILVVDDVSSNRKMLSRILTAKGYVCEQAEDGQQAIDVYRASVESGQTFYAITMDFEMPVMNGPTATALLRALGCTIPIIGVTGNVLPEDIQYFRAQGATEILGKPVNISKFQDFMSAHARHN